jgi:hypothetical protein
MRLHRVLALAILVILSFGCVLGNSTAIAQTTDYSFEATYNIESLGEPIRGDVLRVRETGESTSAPYGLTQLENRGYALFNPETSNVLKADSDPEKFGLKGEDFPLGRLTFLGQGTDKLFGTATGSSTYDLDNLVGTGSDTITITGGEGRFSGAKGILKFSETSILSPDPTVPTKGTWFVKGSFQIAP